DALLARRGHQDLLHCSCEVLGENVSEIRVAYVFCRRYEAPLLGVAHRVREPCGHVQYVVIGIEDLLRLHHCAMHRLRSDSSRCCKPSRRGTSPGAHCSVESSESGTHCIASWSLLESGSAPSNCAA